MKNPYSALLISLLLVLAQCLAAQQENDGGRFSGSLEANGNFFMEDESIGATNTPQYDHQLFGADAWLQLNYSNWGFDVGVRFDIFTNSNLLNPNGSYSDQGIGRWYIKKKINKLGISGGYLYDQIGSGIIFRAFEARPLAIDNALFGVRLTYDFNEDWQAIGFFGRQKQQFGLYGATVRGLNLEGFVTGNEESNWSLAPGFGVVARTIDDETMDNVVSHISTYNVADSIVGLKYNAYAFSIYNTLTAGNFTWYVEGAYKTSDQFFNPLADRLNKLGTDTIAGKLFHDDGYVIYSTLSYAAKGFGITLEGKRTENFQFKTAPFEVLNRGAINFLPPMARENTYRLTARYNAATQELGEMAFQVDVRYSPNKKWGFNVNFANITDLDNNQLYREVYSEIQFKHKRVWQLLGGIQYQEYNQELYEMKPGVPLLKALTPYAEFLYKFDRKKSLRVEAQYMHTDEDFGSWLFGLAEFSIAPHWTFTVSDMYNVNPKKTDDAIHYPRFDVFYSFKSNRFSLSYVKQVEGVVCTGGICRLEPAFSGVKLTVNSTF